MEEPWFDQRDPPTLGWFDFFFFFFWMDGCAPFQLFSFFKMREPGTGSHYDLDLTCTSNIPGLIYRRDAKV